MLSQVAPRVVWRVNNDIDDVDEQAAENDDDDNDNACEQVINNEIERGVTHDDNRQRHLAQQQEAPRVRRTKFERRQSGATTTTIRQEASDIDQLCAVVRFEKKKNKGL